MRIGPEVYHHLRHARRQTFARTDVERHAAPAPIVDVALHGHECLRLRLWCHAFLLAIGPERLAATHGTRVLPADDVLRHLLGRHPTQGEEHLQHLVADRVRIRRHGWIHRPDGQQLQQVVLHHVAQCPGRLVVSGPRPDAERLGRGDLDVLHVIPIPERLEDAVRKAHHEHILHRLLAQVMVDAIDLIFAEVAQQFAVEIGRAGRIVAERFLDDHAPEAALGRCATREPDRVQVRRHGRVHEGRHGEVVEVIVAVGRLGELPEAPPQPLVILRRVRVHRVIMQLLEEVRHPLLIHKAGRHKAVEPLLHLLPERLVRQLRPAHAEHLKSARQQPAVIHIIKCRHELAPRQVARRAEDHRHDALIFHLFSRYLL